MNNNILFGTNTYKKWQRVRRMSVFSFFSPSERELLEYHVCLARAQNAHSHARFTLAYLQAKKARTLFPVRGCLLSRFYHSNQQTNERESAHTHAIVRKTLFRVKIVINFFYRSLISSQVCSLCINCQIVFWLEITGTGSDEWKANVTIKKIHTILEYHKIFGCVIGLYFFSFIKKKTDSNEWTYECGACVSLKKALLKHVIIHGHTYALLSSLVKWSNLNRFLLSLSEHSFVFPRVVVVVVVGKKWREKRRNRKSIL